jgi:hypothetical protein
LAYPRQDRSIAWKKSERCSLAVSYISQFGWAILRRASRGMKGAIKEPVEGKNVIAAWEMSVCAYLLNL